MTKKVVTPTVKKKGTYLWKNYGKTLTVDGVPIAKVIVKTDDLLSTTSYFVQYLDRMVGGQNGFVKKEMAQNHIIKHFGI